MPSSAGGRDRKLRRAIHGAQPFLEERSMMQRTMLAVAVAALGSLASSQASAAACAGPSSFADVLGTSGFCTSIEWLKNRAVTLGCNPAGTLYCPSDTVTREAMAAFMNRLGAALTPVVQYVDAAPTALGGFDCQTPDFAVTGYPRQAQALASISTQFDAAARFYGRIYFSTNGGVSWTNLNNNVVHRANTSGPAAWAHLSQQAILNLNVGTTYRFATFAAQEQTAAALTDARCTLTVRIENRNGASAPFDSSANDGAAGPSDGDY
jgi:hypothetical protein